MNLSEVVWLDQPEQHEHNLILFDNITKSIPRLAEQRDFIEELRYGFGHAAFSGLWYELVKLIASPIKFLEIGVHRGASLSVVDLSAALLDKLSICVGLGPLNGVGGFYEERDYEPDVKFLFDKFNESRYPQLIRGLSTDPVAIAKAQQIAPFDIVYIDGCHEYDYVKHDLQVYSPMVRSGGYLVLDDCCNSFNLPDYHFKGFESATQAVDEQLPPATANTEFKFLFNLMHLRLYQKVN